MTKTIEIITDILNQIKTHGLNISKKELYSIYQQVKQIYYQNFVDQNTKTVYISYDLNIASDFDGLFEWLYYIDAQPVTNNVAKVNFKYEKDFITELKNSFSNRVKYTKHDTVCIIYNDINSDTIQYEYIVGKRPDITIWDMEEDNGF